MSTPHLHPLPAPRSGAAVPLPALTASHRPAGATLRSPLALAGPVTCSCDCSTESVPPPSHSVCHRPLWPSAAPLFTATPPTAAAAWLGLVHAGTRAAGRISPLGSVAVSRACCATSSPLRTPSPLVSPGATLPGAPRSPPPEYNSSAHAGARRHPNPGVSAGVQAQQTGDRLWTLSSCLRGLFVAGPPGE